MITHKKMSLFDAPEGEIIVHACNSMGMWGSGIAKPFADNYKKSYKAYQRFCEYHNDYSGSACGLGQLSTNPIGEKHYVGYIVTSHEYGPRKDPPELIKIHTALALDSFCKSVYNFLSLNRGEDGEMTKVNVYSNKFNSGLFAVPWEDSELILKTVLKRYKNINWIVCDPEAK